MENGRNVNMSKYYRYRDNFERDQGFPGLRLFDTLEEAYAYLLQDGKDAVLFQCDGIEMERDDIPIPYEWIKEVVEAAGVVEIQIRFSDKSGKDIWILEKEGNKEDYGILHNTFK